MPGREAGGRGLALLWLRIAVDLLKTLMLEHLQNLKQGKSMLNKTLQAFRYNPVTALTLFGAVFTVVISILLALLTTEQYESTARIKVGRVATVATPQGYWVSTLDSYDPYLIQSEFEIIQSKAVLGPVAKGLRLAQIWNSAGEPALSEADTIKLLRERIELRPVRNTSLIEIRVHDRNAREASNIANVLAETYRDLRSEQGQSTAGAATPGSPSVEIIDAAVPGLRSVRPNKQLTVLLGLVGGAGACLALLVLNGRPSSPAAAA